jgi:hypothetical protein
MAGLASVACLTHYFIGPVSSKYYEQEVTPPASPHGPDAKGDKL